MEAVDLDPAPQRAPAQVASAKQRILETAGRLFYNEGMHTVGIDRLISESGVTKATFYKHFGAKDTLIIEYVNLAREGAQASIEANIAQGGTPEDAVRRLVTAIVTETQRAGFRGCPFVNAASEYSDPAHPVREIVAEHRDWYADTVAELFRKAGHPYPGDSADEFILARDGAMTGSYAGDAIAASAALVRTVDRVLAQAR